MTPVGGKGRDSGSPEHSTFNAQHPTLNERRACEVPFVGNFVGSFVGRWRRSRRRHRSARRPRLRVLAASSPPVALAETFGACLTRSREENRTAQPWGCRCSLLCQAQKGVVELVRRERRVPGVERDLQVASTCEPARSVVNSGACRRS